MSNKIALSAINFNVTTAVLLSLTLGINTVQAKVSGDVRLGYYSSKRDTRSNIQTESKQTRLRLRVGYGKSINDNWSAKVRFAGRYSDDQKQDEHKFFQQIPGSDGLRLGEGTLDTFYFRYQKDPDAATKFQITLGRLQTKKELEGVAKKSLDRNNSPNSDVAWTDGLVFDIKTATKWHHQTIIQMNYKEGATEVRRGPLDFSSEQSRLSYFYALEHKDKKATIVQRGIDFSYLPNALCVDGSACLIRKDYLAVVVRGAAKWPIYNSKREFMLAAEYGYAPTTQLKSTAKIGNSGDASGNAYQISANLINFVPNHNVALLFGKVDAGWLLSPDFRNNNNLVEIRYKWVLDKKQKIEARIRQRDEIEQRLSSVQKQVDKDFYVRYTVKF